MIVVWGTAVRRRAVVVAAAAALLPPLGNVAAAPVADTSGVVQEYDGVGRVAAARADCGPGSSPEPGLQGDVPAGDRDTGRSAQGYDCNITRVGGYAGDGSGIVSASYDNCAYMGSVFPSAVLGPSPGVQVVDVSDPTHPVPTVRLTEPAMVAGTWESLKVHPGRKLLVGTGVPALLGAGLLSVYDVSDCAHPQLLNPGPGTSLQMPLPITAHEGGFSPDGRTYWSSGVEGVLSAVDLADPTEPRVIWQGWTGMSAHGFGISPDGNRMYLSNNFGGLTVLDTGAVQRRDPNPQVPQVARMSWTDGWATQHSIPVTYDGHPYLFTVNEGGSGGVKLIDVADDREPEVVNTIKLEINLPENIDSQIGSGMGGSVFAYESHYCSADRPVNPTALACGWFSSGIRVFDVTDPHDVREIGYYNPPAMTDRNLDRLNSSHALASLLGVPLLSVPAVVQATAGGQFDPGQAVTPRTGMVVGGDLSTDWCISPPEWRGNDLWVTCTDNGFLTLRLDEKVYTPPPDQVSTVGS
ncbi:LVIVD repeat-containing protein [Rhodococcus sp. NPDC003318]|uniref:LVIVD repeat-containing protein n=1 Tax=Rhodococcus sp. NPDC003318 TaxID=3364503 RepID=UPI0036CB9338